MKTVDTDLQFNGSSLLIPLFSRLTWTEAGELLLFVPEQLQVKPAELPDDERNHVGRLPVAGVE